MKSETIRAFMKKDFQEVGPMNMVSDAVKKLVKSKGFNVIVVDNNQPIGVLTAQDVSRISKTLGNIQHVKIKDVMSSRIVALPPSSHVGLAGKAMEELGLSVIPIVEHGQMSGVFTMRNLMNVYDQGISLDVPKDMVYVNKDLNGIAASLIGFTNKINNDETLSNNEVCDLLAFQDSLVGYSKFTIESTEELLNMTYIILAKHLAIKYGYEYVDVEGLADYLAMNGSLKDQPKYSNDYVAYTRIFDKEMGSLTKEDFNVNLESALSQ